MASIEDKMAAIEAGAAKAAGVDQEGTITGHLDADPLNERTVKELKALADDLGLEYDPKIKKDALVALIAAEPVQAEEAAIVEDVDQTDAPDATPGVILGVDLSLAADPEDEEPEKDADERKEDKVAGRVLVTYTGLVNLRDDQLHVVGQSMQGQVFSAIAKCEENGKAWYRIEDQAGKRFLISADVVRFMA